MRRRRILARVAVCLRFGGIGPLAQERCTPCPPPAPQRHVACCARAPADLAGSLCSHFAEPLAAVHVIHRLHLGRLLRRRDRCKGRRGENRHQRERQGPPAAWTHGCCGWLIRVCKANQRCCRWVWGVRSTALAEDRSVVFEPPRGLARVKRRYQMVHRVNRIDTSSTIDRGARSQRAAISQLARKQPLPRGELERRFAAENDATLHNNYHGLLPLCISCGKQ